ncbi:hypothetical protein TrRE_jg7241 [Triparma retinervis]|uniref:Uncharacterized protein n=1 Tax=Triparma retinervis TaxID=2557542 RepID=A0A9W6ZS46_9STRA|nr:hypothetical protein TrRE_jg7241 [Triparma retinervis]
MIPSPPVVSPSTSFNYLPPFIDVEEVVVELDGMVHATSREVGHELRAKPQAKLGRKKRKTEPCAIENSSPTVKNKHGKVVSGGNYKEDPELKFALKIMDRNKRRSSKYDTFFTFLHLKSHSWVSARFKRLQPRQFGLPDDALVYEGNAAKKMVFHENTVFSGLKDAQISLGVEPVGKGLLQGTHGKRYKVVDKF